MKKWTMAVAAVPVAAAAALAMQWRDISRYARIEWISVGHGHPEVVPAAGSTSYPDGPGKGVPDGTGVFDSASRGGPAAESQPV
jgi:hypothetical protein